MSDVKENAGNNQPVVDAPNTDRRRAVFFLAVGAVLGSAGLLLSRPARADAGKCYICSGCCNFLGTSDNCSRCGHSWTDHTGRTCT